MARSSPGPQARRRLAWFAFVSCVLGGLIGWIAALSGLGLWGLALGVVITIGTIGAFARRPSSCHATRFMMIYAFAFVLLIWPPLGLAVGLARYVITGQSLGT